MEISDDLSRKSIFSKKSGDFSYFDRDTPAMHMKFTNPKFNARKIDIRSKPSENDNFLHFSQKLKEKNEWRRNNDEKFHLQKDTAKIKKFHMPPIEKESNNDEPSSKRRNVAREQRIKNRPFFLEKSQKTYQNKGIYDSMDDEYSESSLSSSSSFDNDEVKNVLSDKVENAVYEIYGKDVPKSAIKELKNSISFVLREETGHIPKLPDEEYDSYAPYSDTEDDYLDLESEYSDQRAESQLHKADYSDYDAKYSDYEAEYSDYGSEYSEDYYQDYYEYDEENDNEYQNLKLEKLQQIQERQMLIMQERQYQLQVFQYGLPLDKKPIKIYQKNTNQMPIPQEEPQFVSLDSSVYEIPHKKNKKKQNKLIQDITIPFSKSNKDERSKSTKNKDKKSSNLQEKKEVNDETNQSPSPQMKSISIHDFNELPLKSQQETILGMINSNSNPRFISNLSNISNLIGYLLKLENLSETKHYLEIAPQIHQNEDYSQLVNPRSSKIFLPYDTTELLDKSKLLNSPEFNDIISKLKDIVIEIKYPSENFSTIFSTINSLKIKFAVFISGISKTDKTFKNNKNLVSVRFDTSVNVIGESSFQGCQSLYKVTIPSSITIIGDNAFCECNSLRYVNIPNSVKSIGEFAFCECAIREIEIPNSITTINNATFRECVSLYQVIIPSTVTKIGNYAFFLCRSLETINLPSSVTSIGESTFEGCPASSMIPASLIKRKLSTGSTSKWKSSSTSSWMSNADKAAVNGWSGLTNSNQVGWISSEPDTGNVWGMSTAENQAGWSTNPAAPAPAAAAGGWNVPASSGSSVDGWAMPAASSTGFSAFVPGSNSDNGTQRTASDPTGNPSTEKGQIGPNLASTWRTTSDPSANPGTEKGQIETSLASSWRTTWAPADSNPGSGGWEGDDSNPGNAWGGGPLPGWGI